MKQMTWRLMETFNGFPLQPQFHFSNNEDDEFFILNKDKKKGIFKVWPTRILNILEWEEINHNHLKRLVAMKKWLAFIWLQDKYLQEVFNSAHNSDDLYEHASELFTRMELAFSRFEPFYCIEAMIDNKKNWSYISASWGEIDFIAIILPNIFYSICIKCDNWDKIEITIDQIRMAFHRDESSLDGKRFILLNLISRKLWISLSECIFASKILGGIHWSKGDDYWDLDTSIEILKNSHKRGIDSGNINSIDADINARIRFMNWLPIKRQADNFSGKMMNYDAVCHTASTLFDLVSNNPSLISEKERDWFSMIQEQLVKIDATSARGRFLLQMFINHSFDPKLMETIEKTRQKTSTLLENSWITKRDGDLKFLWKDSTHIDLQQVGWKGMWIFLAQEIFWNSLVIQTHYISWVMVQEWLYNIPEFSENLRLLENSSTIEMAIELWRWLIKRINKSDMPEYLRENLDDQFINEENLIFRSSALTEDVEDIWSAPGIYESLKARNSWLDIEIAFKGVIASFFSEKAIIFRTKLGLCHTPLMTVLVQPFSQWAHWSLFATESWIELDISTSNVNTLNEETTSISFDYENNRFKDKIHKDLFQIGKKSFQIFGSVDMEFVIEDEKITILQLRMLNQPNDNNINNGRR